ncbi:MAG: C39 family peptidase [Coriobacteriia bacterium]|nr:C39 family peptidase [Coriobacteriia bacterium]
MFGDHGRDSNKVTRLLLALIALVLALIVLKLAGCLDAAGNDAEQDASGTAASAVVSSSDQAAASSGGTDASSSDGDIPAEYANIDEAALKKLLGNKVAKELMSQAKTNEDAAWIAAHYGEYQQYGEDQQKKLLTLAAKESEALPFVRNYKESETSPESGCDAVRQGIVPELYQWDTRWGWIKYSEHCIGTSGCGVTALAMVYQGLTGDTSKSPYDLSVDSVENNYVHSGTDPDFYAFEAERLGLKCEEVSVSAAHLKSALEAGSIVIVNVGPGDFTTGGHYIVAYALDGLGKLHVRDPYSAVNTAKTWDLDSVAGQAKRFFVFSAKN